MPRTFVIGDVHGCSDELLELLAQLDLEANDHIVFAGDLIHKGPDSIGVLQIALAFKEQCKVTLVAGNHEEKQLRWARNEIQAQLTGKQNPTLGTEGYAELWAQCTPTIRTFLEDSRLYVETEGFLVIHGGMAPKGVLEDISLKELFTLKSSYRDTVKWILFTRYVNPKGFPVVLGSETNADVFWTETYDGWGGTILFGHQPYLEKKVVCSANAVGLDLGCVFGNKLAAVEIANNKIVKEYYVKAKRQYANPYSREK